MSNGKRSSRVRSKRPRERGMANPVPVQHRRMIAEDGIELMTPGKLLERSLTDLAAEELDEPNRSTVYYLKTHAHGLIGGGSHFSFALFGPGFSDHSSVIQALAKTLGWPLLTLDPSQFIRFGEERFSESVQKTFSILRAVNGMVIYFDEFEELLRERSGVARNQTTDFFHFATATFLPQLAKLREAGRVVFAFGTPNMNRIDPAVIRPGRFDVLLPWGPPGQRSRAEAFKKAFLAPCTKRLSQADWLEMGALPELNRVTRTELLFLVKTIKSRLDTGLIEQPTQLLRELEVAISKSGSDLSEDRIAQFENDIKRFTRIDF